MSGRRQDVSAGTFIKRVPKCNPNHNQAENRLRNRYIQEVVTQKIKIRKPGGKIHKKKSGTENTELK